MQLLTDAGAVVVQRNGPPPITPADRDVLLHNMCIAAWRTFAFHATKTANVEGIEQSGLDPAYGGTGAAAGSEAFEQQSQNKVHYAREYHKARDYKTFFETGEGFGSRKPKSLGPAEVLHLSLPASVLATEERDPHDRSAHTTGTAIPPANIRRLTPVPVPKHGEMEERLSWVTHQLKGLASMEAVKSNMPAQGLAKLRELVAAGHEESTLLLMLKNAILANPTEAFMKVSAEALMANPRVTKPYLGGTGLPLHPGEM